MKKNSVYLSFYEETPVTDRYRQFILDQWKEKGLKADHPGLKMLLDRKHFFNQKWFCLFQFHLDASAEDIESIRDAVESQRDALEEMIVSMGHRNDRTTSVWIGSTNPPESPDELQKIEVIHK